MNNKLSIARDEFETASKAFYLALCEHKDLVPKVPRVCPVSGIRHTNPCDEYFNLIYGDFTPKKFAALLKVYPGAAALQPRADVASAAHAALLVARAEDKALKSAAKAARDEKAAYRAQHGGRPLPVNKNAAANWDFLNPALAAERAEYLKRNIDFAKRAADTEAAEAAKRGKRPTFVFSETQVTESANASFDAYVAKLATKIVLPITSVVSLTGSLWSSSVLTVVLADGSKQVWSTHCIWNARYGHNSANGHYTAYAQFPTLRVA